MGGEVGQRAVLEVEVGVQDEPAVQKLALILVKPIDLHVKDKVVADLLALSDPEHLSQLHLSWRT